MDETPDQDQPSRRRFVLRSLGAISGFIGATLGAPLLAFLFGPAIRGRYEWRWLGLAIPPTLRSREPWVRIGPVDGFPQDVPVLTTARVPVQDGWIREEAPVAVYVRRTGTDQAVIFDIHCTHMGCPVRWNPASKRFLSPCHGGVFDDNGRVIAGPPPRPLDRYEAKIERGEVYMGRLILPGA